MSYTSHSTQHPESSLRSSLDVHPPIPGNSSSAYLPSTVDVSPPTGRAQPTGSTFSAGLPAAQSASIHADTRAGGILKLIPDIVEACLLGGPEDRTLAHAGPAVMKKCCSSHIEHFKDINGVQANLWRLEYEIVSELELERPFKRSRYSEDWDTVTGAHQFEHPPIASSSRNLLHNSTGQMVVPALGVSQPPQPVGQEAYLHMMNSVPLQAGTTLPIQPAMNYEGNVLQYPWTPPPSNFSNSAPQTPFAQRASYEVIGPTQSILNFSPKWSGSTSPVGEVSSQGISTDVAQAVGTASTYPFTFTVGDSLPGSYQLGPAAVVPYSGNNPFTLAHSGSGASVTKTTMNQKAVREGPSTRVSKTDEVKEVSVVAGKPAVTEKQQLVEAVEESVVYETPIQEPSLEYSGLMENTNLLLSPYSDNKFAGSSLFSELPLLPLGYSVNPELLNLSGNEGWDSFLNF